MGAIGLISLSNLAQSAPELVELCGLGKVDRL